MLPYCSLTVVVLLFVVGLPVTLAQLPLVCETSPIEGVGENPIVFALRQELIPDSTVPSEEYGSSISVHKNRLVVGDSTGGEATSEDGHAMLYLEEQGGGDLVEMQRFMSPGMAVDGSFAAATALWGDTLVVGAPNREVDGFVSAGAVYIFTRNSTSSLDDVGVWVLEAMFISNAPRDNLNFGNSVDIYEDTIVVGSSTVLGLGQAMVLGRNSTSGEWVEEAYWTPGFIGVNQFGYAVSVYKDRVAISGPIDSFGTGQVYVFARISDGSWVEQASIANPTGGSLIFFGGSLSLYENLLVVGAPEKTEAEESVMPGEAFVFEYDAEAGWSLSQELRPPDFTLFIDYGSQVIAENGVILVSDDRYNVGDLESAGVVFAYTKTDTEWVLAAEITAPIPEQDARFGKAMDMHGTVLGVTSNPLTGVGSAYVFALCVEITPTGTPSISVAPSVSLTPVAVSSDPPSSVPSISYAPSSVTESPTQEPTFSDTATPSDPLASSAFTWSNISCVLVPFFSLLLMLAH